MKRNKHMGKCEEYLAEVNKYMNENNNGQRFIHPELTMSAYVSSIALSLAVIADKMCEEDERDEGSKE